MYKVTDPAVIRHVTFVLNNCNHTNGLEFTDDEIDLWRKERRITERGFFMLTCFNYKFNLLLRDCKENL